MIDKYTYLKNQLLEFLLNMFNRRLIVYKQNYWIVDLKILDM